MIIIYTQGNHLKHLFVHLLGAVIIFTSFNYLNAGIIQPCVPIKFKPCLETNWLSSDPWFKMQDIKKTLGFKVDIGSVKNAKTVIVSNQQPYLDLKDAVATTEMTKI